MGNTESTTLHILIDEGPQYFLDKLIIQGNEKLDKNKIIEILEPAVGEVFRPFFYINQIQKLKNYYGDIGMPFVEITESYSDSMALIWQIDISNEKKYRFNFLDYDGQGEVIEKLISRELLFKSGDFYNFSIFQESRKRVFELGAYNNVMFHLDNINEESGKLDVKLTVSEALRRTWDMNIGVRQGRVEAVNQSYIFSQLDWRNRNLFGRAKKLRVLLSLNLLWDQIQMFDNIQPSYNFEMSYTEPWLLMFRFPTTFKLYSRKDIYSPFNKIVSDKNDELSSSGFDISSLYRYREILNALLTFSVRSIESKLSDVGKELQRNVEFQLRFDNRDSFLYPSKGWNIQIKSNMSANIRGNEDSWYMVNASISKYTPLWKNASIASRIESGLIREMIGQA
ncbi:MAG: BamA/TamA family outer membrane protein, partial [Candidatus Marinimicrobia bacterium]|nr:BamA/TamA family outer membrane protein [Candidatus Neomarinimicrobiota bacterium]